jgi:hypothetical protein
LKQALEISGVPEQVMTAIMENATTDTPNLMKIRNAFSEWSRQAHITLHKTQALSDRPRVSRGLPTASHDAPAGSAPSDTPFKDLLYEKMNGLFGPSGNQYLALQLPSRFLDKGSFAYKTEGVYSNFTKPSQSDLSQQLM